MARTLYYSYKRSNSGELRHTKHNGSKLMPSLCSGTALAIYLKALTRRFAPRSRFALIARGEAARS